MQERALSLVRATAWFAEEILSVRATAAMLLGIGAWAALRPGAVPLALLVYLLAPFFLFAGVQMAIFLWSRNNLTPEQSDKAQGEQFVADCHFFVPTIGTSPTLIGIWFWPLWLPLYFYGIYMGIRRILGDCWLPEDFEGAVYLEEDLEEEEPFLSDSSPEEPPDEDTSS